MKRKIIVNELIEEQNCEYKTHINSVKSNDIIESNYKPIGKRKNRIFEMTKKYEDLWFWLKLSLFK